MIEQTEDEMINERYSNNEIDGSQEGDKEDPEEIEVFERIYRGDTMLTITAHVNEYGSFEYFTYDCFVIKFYNKDNGRTRWEGRQGADSLEEALMCFCHYDCCDIESITEEIISIYEEIRKNEEYKRLEAAKPKKP